MAAYEEQNKRVLGLTSMAGWQALEQPNEFLELVNLWGSSDSEDFLTVLAFLSPHARDSEEKRQAFQARVPTPCASQKDMDTSLMTSTTNRCAAVRTSECPSGVHLSTQSVGLVVTLVRGS